MPLKKILKKEVKKAAPKHIEPAPVEDSIAKKEYRRMMEVYKVKNPVKYAQKEAAMLAKLATL